MKRGLLLEAGRCLPWLLLFLLASGRRACAVEPPLGEGEPLMQYFSPRDYHGGTQCLCATQDARGVMYIGSLGLVLEYDGSTWRKIDHRQQPRRRPRLRRGDGHGVRRRGEQSGLPPGPAGRRADLRLVAGAAAARPARTVGTVYGVHVTPDGVFFVGTKTGDALARRHLQDVGAGHRQPAQERLGGGPLYVSSPGGRSAATGKRRVRARVGRSAFPPRLGALDPGRARRSLLLATFHDGLFTLRDGVVTPRDGECGGFLKEKGIAQDAAPARRVAGGRHRLRRFADPRPGAALPQPRGQHGGLHGTNIFNLFEDAEGGVWIGLQSGVTRAEVNSPLLRPAGRAGRRHVGAPTARAAGSARWCWETATGLYRVVPADPSTATSAHVERVPQDQEHPSPRSARWKTGC